MKLGCTLKAYYSSLVLISLLEVPGEGQQVRDTRPKMSFYRGWEARVTKCIHLSLLKNEDIGMNKQHTGGERWRGVERKHSNYFEESVAFLRNKHPVADS